MKKGKFDPWLQRRTLLAKAGKVLLVFLLAVLIHVVLDFWIRGHRVVRINETERIAGAEGDQWVLRYAVNGETQVEWFRSEEEVGIYIVYLRSVGRIVNKEHE